jgi:hypothetical protein
MGSLCSVPRDTGMRMRMLQGPREDGTWRGDGRPDRGGDEMQREFGTS